MKSNQNKIFVPVQCSIIVPLDIDIKIDNIEDATDETTGGYSFVSLDKLSNADDIGVKLIEAAQVSPEIEQALYALSAAVMKHREKYPDTKAKLNFLAGIIEEQDI